MKSLLRYIMIICFLAGCAKVKLPGGVRSVDGDSDSDSFTVGSIELVDQTNDRRLTVISFEQGFYTAYDRDDDLYVSVSKNGEYRDQIVYFQSPDCTGDAFLERFEGEVKKTVIRAKNSFWVVDRLKDQIDLDRPYSGSVVRSIWLPEISDCQSVTMDIRTEVVGVLEPAASFNIEPFSYSNFEIVFN